MRWRSGASSATSAGAIRPPLERRRRLAAEGLGTLLLLAVVIGSGIMAERLRAGTRPSPCSPTRGHGRRALRPDRGVRPGQRRPLQSGRVARHGASAASSGEPACRAMSLAQLLGRHAGRLARPRDVRPAVLQLSEKVRCGAGAMARRRRRDLRAACSSILRVAGGPGGGDGRLLHRRGLLVHRVDLVRQPGGGSRSHAQRQLRRDRSRERAGLRDRRAGRRRGWPCSRQRAPLRGSSGNEWCARQVSNLQPLPSEGSTLSIELRAQRVCILPTRPVGTRLPGEDPPAPGPIISGSARIAFLRGACRFFASHRQLRGLDDRSARTERDRRPARRPHQDSQAADPRGFLRFRGADLRHHPARHVRDDRDAGRRRAATRARRRASPSGSARSARSRSRTSPTSPR